MYARINTTRWHPEKREEATELTHDTIIPAYREVQGFRGYYLLSDPDGDKAMAITLWETREDMEASAPVAQRMIPMLREVIVERPTAEVFEVVINAE